MEEGKQEAKHKLLCCAAGCCFSLPRCLPQPLFLSSLFGSSPATEEQKRDRIALVISRLIVVFISCCSLSPVFLSFLFFQVWFSFRLFFSSGSDHFCLVSLLFFVVQTGWLSIAVLVRVRVSLFCNRWVFLRFLKSPKAEGT